MINPQSQKWKECSAFLMQSRLKKTGRFSALPHFLAWPSTARRFIPLRKPKKNFRRASPACFGFDCFNPFITSMQLLNNQIFQSSNYQITHLSMNVLNALNARSCSRYRRRYNCHRGNRQPSATTRQQPHPQSKYSFVSH